jgi:hypothetical protein
VYKSRVIEMLMEEGEEMDAARGERFGQMRNGRE